MGQGLQPPLYHTRARQPERSHAATPENPGDPQTLPHISHNDHTHTNAARHNAVRTTNSYQHNGIDNPAFTHTDAQNANTLHNTQQPNSNILIQAGAAQGGTQPPAVHVSLNTLPRTAQHDSNAQMPTIHVNLNSYPANGQQAQQDSSFPSHHTAHVTSLQTQQNRPHTERSDPRMQSGQSYPSDPRVSGHVDTGHQALRGLIPTGYTHLNSNNISQRNADTQTYQQDTGRRSRSDRRSDRQDSSPSSAPRQMPWDLIRGTPAYPSGRHQRRQPPPESPSDTTDYTTQPPIRETRPPSHSQNTLRSRAPVRQEAPSVDRQARGRSADRRSPNARSVTQLEATHNTHRSPRTQRESAQRDIRDQPRSQSAPRQEATHSNNPQALPLMSQQASVGHSAMSQGPRTQQGSTAPQGVDSRVLADPNHLPQAHMAHQHRAAPIQTPPQGLARQTQPVIQGANRPSQGGSAPVPSHPAQPNPSNLTQAALKSHTAKAQVFQNRNQQTQAALLHPGPQAPAPAAGAQQPPPPPPPAIPLAQFKTLPKERSRHRSPIRGPQPPRPPANIPVAQRHQQRTNANQRPATMPATHHHHPGDGRGQAGAHRHAHAHGHGRGHTAHSTNPRQVSETQHESQTLQPTDAICLRV